MALAATALVATLAIRTLAGDLALRQAITDRPPGDRSATVSRSQSVDDLRPLDTVARAALARLHAGATRREMMLRVLSDGRGGLFRLAAIDGVASSVRLTSGRLPGPCRNGRCEVLLIGSKQPVLDPSLGVVVTGHATLDRTRCCSPARSTRAPTCRAARLRRRRPERARADGAVPAQLRLGREPRSRHAAGGGPRIAAAGHGGRGDRCRGEGHGADGTR